MCLDCSVSESEGGKKILCGRETIEQRRRAEEDSA